MTFDQRAERVAVHVVDVTWRQRLSWRYQLVARRKYCDDGFREYFHFRDSNCGEGTDAAGFECGAGLKDDIALTHVGGAADDVLALADGREHVDRDGRI